VNTSVVLYASSFPFLLLPFYAAIKDGIHTFTGNFLFWPTVLLIHPSKAVIMTQNSCCNWIYILHHKKCVLYVILDFHRGDKEVFSPLLIRSKTSFTPRRKPQIAYSAPLCWSYVLLWSLDPWMWERQAVPKRRKLTTIQRRVTSSHKSEDLKYVKVKQFRYKPGAAQRVPRS